MNEFIKLDINEQKLVINNTAEKLGISNAIVEKDFWVSWTLNYLFNDFHYSDFIYFKGGTSLSKVYKLINRFSEDIDLALDWEMLGYKRQEGYLSRSNRQQSIFNKKINTKTELMLKNIWLPLIENDFKDIFSDEFKLYIDEEDLQTICFQYPRQYSDGSILQVIRLEVGALAETNPSADVDLQSLISEIYPNVFSKNKVRVKCVEPIRTFFEKLLILHREAHRTNGNYPVRYSRHYYDVFQMIKSNLLQAQLNKIDILKSVIEFKKKFYPCNWARYNDIYAGKLLLVPKKAAVIIFKEDYGRMSNMIFGHQPSFEEILSEIKLFENKINAVIIKKDFSDY